MLDEERQFFDEKRSEWLKVYHGQFAVVKGRELIGMFSNESDALAAGAKRFGLSSFLLRCVQQHEEEATIPALTMGLIHADPA